MVVILVLSLFLFGRLVIWCWVLFPWLASLTGRSDESGRQAETVNCQLTSHWTVRRTLYNAENWRSAFTGKGMPKNGEWRAFYLHATKHQPMLALVIWRRTRTEPNIAQMKDSLQTMDVQFIVGCGLRIVMCTLPSDHLLLDRPPNIGPLMSRWELDKFKNCWKKALEPLKSWYFCISHFWICQVPNEIWVVQDYRGTVQ